MEAEWTSTAVEIFYCDDSDCGWRKFGVCTCS